MLPPTIEASGTAHCLSSLSRCIGEINEGWKDRWDMQPPGLCFRGVDDEAYDLNPSLLRPPFPSAFEDLAHIENGLWVDFRLRSKPLLGYQVQNAWQALLIMQQHGFPTRLLDWSGAIAIGVYFAVRNIEMKQDGAVWVLAGRYLMERRGTKGAWRTAVGDPRIESMALREGPNGLEEFVAQPPVPLNPDQLVPRMIAQRGIYTLHTFEKYALEKLATQDREAFGDQCFLHKIIIPAPAKASMRAELAVVAGVSEGSLFPDLEGFAREFVWEHKRKAIGEIGPTAR